MYVDLETDEETKALAYSRQFYMRIVCPVEGVQTCHTSWDFSAINRIVDIIIHSYSESKGFHCIFVPGHIASCLNYYTLLKRHAYLQIATSIHVYCDCETRAYYC